MDILHDDLINMVYAMVYGKRKLKFLQDHVAGCLSSPYFSQKGEIRILDKQQILRMIHTKFDLKPDKVVFLEDTKLTLYDREEIIDPKRDHLFELLRIVKQLQAML